MRTARIWALGVVLLAVTGCRSAAGTEVTAIVADNFAAEGLEAGDPLADATLTLFEGDTVVLETTLDGSGRAVIQPEPGTYDVQVQRTSADDPLCFWGATQFAVEFPAEPITLEVGFICA
jgi:hypothetical protein